MRHTTGVSHGREVPLLPILGLLRDYFSITDSDDHGQAREMREERLKALRVLRSLTPASTDHGPNEHGNLEFTAVHVPVL